MAISETDRPQIRYARLAGFMYLFILLIFCYPSITRCYN
jgi:hypothetical protein